MSKSLPHFGLKVLINKGFALLLPCIFGGKSAAGITLADLLTEGRKLGAQVRHLGPRQIALSNRIAYVIINKGCGRHAIQGEHDPDIVDGGAIHARVEKCFGIPLSIPNIDEKLYDLFHFFYSYRANRVSRIRYSPVPGWLTVSWDNTPIDGFLEVGILSARPLRPLADSGVTLLALPDGLELLGIRPEGLGGMTELAQYAAILEAVVAAVSAGRVVVVFDPGAGNSQVSTATFTLAFASAMLPAGAHDQDAKLWSNVSHAASLRF